MFLDAPLPIRLFVQSAAWMWIVALPGVLLAAEFLRGRRVSVAVIGALTLGFGLAATPTIEHVFVLVSGHPADIAGLLVVATVINAVGAWRWRAGLRLDIEPLPRAQGLALGLGLLVVLAVTFVTTDGTYPLVAADGWKSSGTTQCFMDGTFRYMQVPTPAPPRPFGPQYVRPTDGGEFITFGNIALAATHTLIYGAAGLRFLRCAVGLLLGLLGWIVWHHVGGRERFAVVGLAVFALNPYVVTTGDMDRNILALAYAALMYVLTARLRAGPGVVGLVAGFTVGLGLNLAPALFLVPLVWHFWRRPGPRVRNVAVLLGTATAIGALWAVLYLPFPLGLWPSRRGDAKPWVYDIANFELHSRFLLGFPFASPWIKGPHNAFPPWLHLPLHVYRSFGALLLGLASVGVVSSWRRSRSDTLELIAWGLPTFLLVAAMAVFTAYLQTRLVFAALLPLLVFLLIGISTVARRPRTGAWAAAAATAMVAVGMMAAHRDVAVDQRLEDPRFSAYLTDMAFVYGEESAANRQRRQAYLAPRLLPDFFGDPELRNVIASPMPAGYYEQRVGALSRFDDLFQPDIVSRAPFLPADGAPKIAHPRRPGRDTGGKPAFVRLEPGAFIMGSPATEVGRGSDEVEHSVRITRAIEIQAREVTQGEYRDLMGSNPAFNVRRGDDSPVEQVSWLHAVTYANALSRREGLTPCYTIDGDEIGWPDGPACAGYRLPTEAEWEYAARSRPPGVQRLIGGVWEWCWDWYGPYPTEQVSDPTGPASGNARISRGSYASHAERIRPACRRAWSPVTRSRDQGFRLVRTVSETKPTERAEREHGEGGDEQGEIKKQPWAGGDGSKCEPRQVNDLGVGRPCKSQADCAGFKASMCPSAVKGPTRASVCTVHCDTDADCGPGAMCGLVRGAWRACYPKHCTDFAYDKARLRPPKGPPPKHAGAALCDPGFSFYSQGWGAACKDSQDCRGEGKKSKGCNGAIYPPGVMRCTSECRTDADCGDNAYCSYTEVKTFTLCLPRCPEQRHRNLTAKPDSLDVCKVQGSIVDLGRTEHRIGAECQTDEQCGAGGVCGAGLAGSKRKPVGCTRKCRQDADCGRNALCVDLEHGLPDADRSPADTRYCVPACWGI